MISKGKGIRGTGVVVRNIGRASWNYLLYNYTRVELHVVYR